VIDHGQLLGVDDCPPPTVLTRHSLDHVCAGLIAMLLIKLLQLKSKAKLSFSNTESKTSFIVRMLYDDARNPRFRKGTGTMEFRLSLTLALLLLQTPQDSSTLQQAPKASIEGTVVSSTTGEPLERAHVTLLRILQPPSPATTPQPATGATPPSQVLPVITQNDGKFRFDLEPGQYRVRVQRNGYATQEYGQRVLEGAGTVLTLNAGQAMKQLTLKMVPGAVVTGRVRDSKGEPIAGAQVSLLRSIYGVNGVLGLTSGGGATTDDRGEYRIFWVSPGRYIVSVASASTSLSIPLILNQPNLSADRVFLTTYYPSTTDGAHAAMLDVQPATETTDIIIAVNPPTTYRVRGRLIDGTTGQPPRTASVSLGLRQQAGAPDLILMTTPPGTTTYNPNGDFEIRSVIPGSYWLRAQVSSNSDASINPNLVVNARTASELPDTVISTRIAAQVPIDVVAADIEGLAVTLSRGVNISVQLSVEGQELTSVSGYDRIRLLLRPTTLNAFLTLQRSPFSADGSGNLADVQPGEYRIQAQSPRPDLYIKEARFERKDVLNDPWQITSTTSGTLTVVLSTKAGQIEGTLKDASSQPVPGNQVLLIPDQAGRSELYKVAMTDQSGHFVFRGIPPESYKVFAWEVIEPNAFWDRDFPSKYAAQSRPVRIQEGLNETIELKIIPVD
jgi:Carboxypeptidase regulatory-like domain